MKESYKDRMRNIGKIVYPYSDGSPEDIAFKQRLQKRQEMDPRYRKEMRKKWEYVQAHFMATLANGAGLPADQLLRYYLDNVNQRIWHGGLDNVPVSFNFYEAFLEYEPSLNYFKLLPEIDHSFSLEDFFDYVTSKDCSANPYSCIDLLKENTIYNYSSFDDPHKIMLSTKDGSEYGILSFSMIRRGPEIAVICLGGESVDLKETTDKLRRVEDVPDRIKKARVPNSEELERKAEPLEKTEDLWRTIASCRLNVEKKTIDVRYFSHDAGDRFIVGTDDANVVIQTLEDHTDMEALNQRMQEYTERMNEKNTLFEVCQTALLLPLYYAFKITLVRNQPVKTGIEELIHDKDINAGTRYAITMKLPKLTTVKYKRVSSLRIVDSEKRSPIGRSYSPPLFQVDVSGFWRRLHDPLSYGKDPIGDPVQGRTWVKGHARWKDRPQEEQRVVFIKSKVSAARRIAEFEETAYSIASPEELSNEPIESCEAASTTAHLQDGYVYILVNASLGQDIFKVGCTSKIPDQRAKEISSSTGVPVPFLVAESWKVSDIYASEKLAHAALKEYRVNTHREFFQASFQTIRKTIERVIDQYIIT